MAVLTRSLLACALFAALTLAAHGQEPAGKIPLKVVYVGTDVEALDAADTKARRVSDFAEFLARNFTEMEVIARDHFDPAACDAHVVLLDWGQYDIDLTGLENLESPLGPREDWDIPTVLLGSAGLLMATPWQLPGSWG